MSFCGCCSNIFESHIFRCEYTRISHHKSITSFVAAADTGCIICRQAFRSLTLETQEILRYYGRTLAALFEDSSVGTLPVGQPSGTAVLPSFTEFQFVPDFDFQYMRDIPQEISLSIRVNPSHRFEMYKRGIIDADASFSLRVVEKLQKRKTCILWVTFHQLHVPLHMQRDKPKIASRIPTSTNTGSSETWDLVRTWLEECTTKHSACNFPKPEWRPSRLVDLGPWGSSNDAYQRFSVVKGSELSPGEKYITLSHRWGVSHTPRITVQNLGAYEQGMPTSVLPISFRDAITVAQRLGIRYIWIDSLCIVQDGDNGQDWKREAPLMEKVYANALCNLAANWGSDLAGLFFERDTTLFGHVQQRLQVKVPRTIVIDRTDDLTFISDYNLFGAENNWVEEVLDAPLNKRGWVLQERILAPRIIHFCRREVFWECCEKTVSESFPARLPPTSQSNKNIILPNDFRYIKRLIHYRYTLGDSTHYGRTGPDPDEARRLYKAWHGVVEVYSQCQLTRQSDKLVAIAGLARSLSPFLRDLYVAGVWSRNLLIDLAWYLAEPEPVSRDSSLPYRAPSFSWASVNGHVRWLIPIYRAEAFLVQLLCIKARRLPNQITRDATADVELLLEDVFGPCDFPTVELQVTGNLHAAVLRRSHRDEPGASESMPSHNELSSGVTNLQTLVEMKVLSIKLDSVLGEAELEDKLFYYIPWYDRSAAIGPLVKNPGYIPGYIIALIVEPVDSELGRFRRVGIMWTSHHTPDTRAVLLGSRRDGPLHPSWSFNEESGLHTIYII